VPLKVMPLGASLTDGYNVPGGYRIDLEDDLIASGIRPDFVGSLSNGPASLADKNHEGHSGYRIDQIRRSIDGWIGSYQPDVVLLLIGTNDVLQDYQLAGAPNRLADLVDRVHALRPATKIFVSSLPPIATASDNSQADAYNAAIPTVVQARALAGRPIWFVNGNASLTASDLADGVHLTAVGYSKLADAWHGRLISTLGLPPEEPPPRRPPPNGPPLAS
jgi:lysophospholipase L1-like esterase